MKTKSRRLANVELLRVVAMLMVVMLHYLGKGELLPEMSIRMGATGYVAWILESLSIVAVNVYVLISGYFLVESEFKLGKIVKLVLQVLFYTVLITVLAFSFGLVGKEEFGIYNMIVQLFPFQLEQYWFMTSYLVMYILSPVLAMAAKTLSQKNLKVVTLLMVAFMCIEKSILPVQIKFDQHGYDALWFICLFLVAAYVRLYGIKFLEKRSNAILLYVACCVLMMGENMVFSLVYEKLGEMGHLVTTPYHYNHIFNLLASLGFFMFFLNVKIKDGLFANLVCKIAPYTLGVYLWHEHIYVRYLWPEWFGAGESQNVGIFLLKAFGTVLCVFVIGIVVDYLRGLVFKFGSKLIHVKKS